MVDTSIRQRMQEDLRAAMQARDRLAVSVLRYTLAAVANAEAVDPATAGRHATEVERKHLTEDDIVAIITAERDDLRAATTEMTSLHQDDKADELAQQARLLDRYL
jgi:uncharacterized protein YqeY